MSAATRWKHISSQTGYVQQSDTDAGVPTDAACEDHGETVDVSFSGGKLTNWASNLFSK